MYEVLLWWRSAIVIIALKPILRRNAGMCTAFVGNNCLLPETVTISLDGNSGVKIKVRVCDVGFAYKVQVYINVWHASSILPTTMARSLL